MRSEVDNGGFPSVLYNSTGMVANNAVCGAELIGAGKFADLFRKVRSIVSEDGLSKIPRPRLGGSTFTSLGVMSERPLAWLKDSTVS